MSLLPLEGLRILDLTTGPAGGLATMILADFGAHVTRVCDPEFEGDPDVASARMWLRGKATASTWQAEISDADVVIISLPHGHQGIDYETCLKANPTVVYCEISAMGNDVRMPLCEPAVAAKTGRMKQMEAIIPETGPIFAAVQVATHATAMNVVSGVLAALHKRRRLGVGDHLSTSLVQGLMPYDMGGSIALQLRAQQPPRPPEETPTRPRAPFMPTLNYHPVQCADGKWLQLGNLLPHLFANFMSAIGLADELVRLPEHTEEVRDAILTTIQSRTRDEWMEIFVADGGVAAHPYLEPQETLSDPDMTDNGHVIVLGETRQLGPVANLTGTPARITTEPKGGEGWHVTPGSPTRQAPLADVTVVELATIIASPLGASFLADMGARVIKVEAVGGDPFRNMGGFGSMRCNQGKESISVDLKSDAGQELVRKLIQGADIVIHNYRPGVPERLGIGYEQLRAINPGLIYVSANGYGPSGPGAKRPSTHPIPGAAMGGAGYQAGGVPGELLDIPGLRDASRRLMAANEVNPDPNTAVVVCASAMLGLTAREQTGMGQQIFVDMFGANAYANFDAMVDYPDKPARPPLGPELKGPSPTSRLYPARAGWVFLGITRAAEWHKFCEVTGHSDWHDDFSSGTDVQGKLATLFLEKDASDWDRLFENSGVACVIADASNSAQFFFEACHENSPWMMAVPSKELTPYYRHRPMVSFAGSDLPAGAPEEAAGHAVALMAELNYDAGQIEQYFTSGVLWKPS